ncbi:hypothetical protein GJ496_009668 [Pomphorhynchus laevis]|nr:hypothetical protein GJ496_009668 [Pomphorhynchus laevis]
MANVTICGKYVQDHDLNLRRFNMAQEVGLTYSQDKCINRQETIDILGYRIDWGQLSPDPDQLRELINMYVPNIKKSLQRCIDLFS